MADRSPEEYQARYQGLTGLVRLLVRQLTGPDHTEPGPVQQTSAGGPLPKSRRASAISAGDPTYGRFDNGNLEAVRREIGMQAPARGRVVVSNASKYVTGNETVDQAGTPGERYPLHRLTRDPSLRSILTDINERERARVARLFDGQISGRAGRIDRAVDEAQTGRRRKKGKGAPKKYKRGQAEANRAMEESERQGGAPVFFRY